jgi:hypothetical protein
MIVQRNALYVLLALGMRSTARHVPLYSTIPNTVMGTLQLMGLASLVQMKMNTWFFFFTIMSV